MSLIATGDRPSVEALKIENAAFFDGVLDFGKYRAASRIDRTASDEQALGALQMAVVSTNQQLTRRVNQWIAEGYATLNAVPNPLHMPPDHYLERYQRAVYCAADATLAENFRDFDSTGEGHQRADSMEGRIDAYRRESNYAVADMLGCHRRAVELL